jgi:periplasmic divalent cation tolerance protein
MTRKSADATLLTTVASMDDAARLARVLLEERVAACVTIIPGVRSIYRWQEQITDQGECLLLVKTALEATDRARAAILERHPYEVPEVLVLAAADVPPPYRCWLEESTS